MPDFSWAQLFANNLEFFGFITGILSVLLLIPVKYPRLQYLAWPFGVMTSAAYFFIFRDWQLYGSTYLQVYFVVVSLVGTWFWRGQLVGHDLGESRTGLGRLIRRVFGVESVPTSYGTRGYIGRTILAATIAAVPVYFILRNYNDASPRWDGLILVLSIAAIWLQTKKYVQSWYLWIAVDLIAVPLYWSQNLGATSILYVLYMIMCLFGLYTWRKEALPEPESLRYAELEMWPDPSLDEVPYGASNKLPDWEAYWNKEIDDDTAEMIIEQSKARFP